MQSDFLYPKKANIEPEAKHDLEEYEDGHTDQEEGDNSLLQPIHDT
jgi:hypothetical protein